jgi:hypothetical protein
MLSFAPWRSRAFRRCSTAVRRIDVAHDVDKGDPGRVASLTGWDEARTILRGIQSDPPLGRYLELKTCGWRRNTGVGMPP